MAVSRRRARGTRRDPVSLGWQIERPSKELLDAVAIRLGVSSAVLLERMIDELGAHLTDQGIPGWWPDELPRDNELELPISA